MKRYVATAVMTLLFCFFALPAFAQSAGEIDTLKKEIEALKAGQKAIQKDIQDIKNQLRAKRRPAPPEFKEAIIDLDDNPSKGDESAKVTIVEFSDYQ